MRWAGSVLSALFNTNVPYPDAENDFTGPLPYISSFFITQHLSAPERQSLLHGFHSLVEIQTLQHLSAYMLVLYAITEECLMCFPAHISAC
jgi:hypothetical protein